MIRRDSWLCSMPPRNPQRQNCNSIQECAAVPRRRRRIPHRLLLAAAACYSSTAVIAEYSSLRPWAFARPYSFSPLPVEESYLHVSRRLRGGGGSDSEQDDPLDGETSKSSPHEASSYEADKAETSSDSSTAESSAALRLASLVPSLFQINNNVKFDASLDDDDRDSDLTTVPSDSAKASSFTRSTSTNGRGGAMLVKPKPAPPRRIFQWLAPLETDRVAPLADRLLVDDGDASTSRNNDPSASELDAAAKPTSYVPYRASSGHTKDVEAAASDGQPNEATSRTEALHVQSSQGGPDRVQSTGDLDTSGDVARSSAPELETDAAAPDEMNDDAQATQTYNISYGSTAEIGTVIVPESPYVSSGYVSVQNAKGLCVLVLHISHIRYGCRWCSVVFD